MTALKSVLMTMKPQIEMAIPKHLDPDRMLRIAMTAISTNPRLAQCSPESFLGALMSATQLGLEPNTPTGQAYLIPYRNNKKGCYECQYQTGYKGLLDLAYRSKEFKTIYAKSVDEADEFSYSFGLNPDLIHKPASKKTGKAIAFYAVYQTVNGGYNFEVMTRDEIIAHGKQYSKSYSSGPWQSNFDEMAKKTVLKKLLKTAPMSTDLRNAHSIDEGVIRVNTSNIDAGIPLLAGAETEFNDEGTEVQAQKEEAREKIKDLIDG